MNKDIYLQIMGFLVVSLILYSIGGAIAVAFSSTGVAVWEFLHPSKKHFE